MASFFLRNLSLVDRQDLIERLWQSQAGRCFICEREIDLVLHKGSLDIDHVEPQTLGGKDDPSNFALTHDSCNRSKQATDLRVARVLARFAAIRAGVADQNRGANLSDVLSHFGGACQELQVRVEPKCVKTVFGATESQEIVELPLYIDQLSGIRYFFASVPIQYLYHDDRINPRAIGTSVNGLVEEFHKKRPQLHVGLAWMAPSEPDGTARVQIFDGQHKVAAQVLLGVRSIPVRVFVNPDLDVLLTANTNAGTTLKQVAFDKSVQRHLGSALFWDRVERYRADRSLPVDSLHFSERDLVNHFKGEWREMRRYILDSVRDSITHSPENRLRDYVDYAGKGKERPLSYSTIEKTFFSFFIYGDVLDTPINYRLEENENPRQLERDQIIQLMNLVAEVIYEGEYDPMLGTSRIENQVQQGVDVPEGHLRAFRLSKEEILYNWLKLARDVIKLYFLYQGRPIQETKLFQYRFPEPLWDNVRNFLISLVKMPIWVNRDLSVSVFGGKQNYDYWQSIFETGKTPSGQQVLTTGIDLTKMIQA